jgi:hypothetical protein
VLSFAQPPNTCIPRAAIAGIQKWRLPLRHEHVISFDTHAGVTSAVADVNHLEAYSDARIMA